MVAKVFVSGFVHGVGFRHFIKKKALELGLTGWVKNLPTSQQGGPDDRVEALFEGPRDKIEQAITSCSKGPFLSEIKDVEVQWIEKEGEGNGENLYRDFRIFI